MKNGTVLFKHYCVNLVGTKGDTTMRFRTENEALAFRKGVIYSQIYAKTIDYAYVGEVFIDFLSIELYDL